MKTSVLIAMIAAAGLLGYALVARGPRTDPAPEASALPASPPVRKSPPPTSTLTDGLEIFRKAFWRSPAAGDEVLNAERREWADSGGLSRWQWFIAVRPSPELLKYLREENAFGLAPSGSPSPIDDPPSWFAFNPAEVEVLRSPTANLQFIFRKEDNALYATNSGSGFARGAPPQSRPAPPPSSRPGRLPPTRPPRLTGATSRNPERDR